MGNAATRALDSLMTRRADARKRLGVDEPLLLSTVMHESLTDEEYSQCARKLEGIRLLPLDKHLVRGKQGEVNQFPQMVKFWCSPQGPFAELPVDQWMNFLNSTGNVAGHA
ncbi:MAG: hypothetical protein AB7H77_00635 [Bdellovibrionales bacterium]